MSSSGGFQSQTRPREIGFAKQFVQPPSARYLTRDDRLYVLSYAVFTFRTLAIRARILTPAGEVVTLDFAHATSEFARVSKLEGFDLREGFLLDVGVFNTGGTIRRGETYVQIGLLRGLVDTGSFVTTFASGYIEGLGSVFWPDGPVESTIAGKGRLHTFTGTTPAAGADWAETVPTNARWRIRSVRFNVITGATAGTRRVYVKFLDDGPTTIFEVGASVTQSTNATREYNFVPGMAQQNLFAQRVEATLTDFPVLLQAGGIESNIRSLQATDTVTAPTIVVEEWIEE